MTIRSRLNLSILVSLAVTLLVCLFIVTEMVRVRTVLNDNLEITALSKQIVLLHGLTYDYVNSPSTRSESQWLSTYVTLDWMLKDMSAKPEGMTRIPSEVVENYANIKSTFDQITAIVRGLDKSGPDQRKRLVSLESHMASMLLRKNQELYDWVLSATTTSNKRLLSTLKRDGMVFMLMLAAVSVIIATALYLLKRGVLLSIIHLRQGVDTITHGDLDYRIPPAGSDELGDLSIAFNTMAEELRTLYARLEMNNQAIQDSENRFRALVEQANDGVMIVRENASVAYISPSVQHLLGYSPETFMASDVFHYVHPDDRGRLRRSFDYLIDTTDPLTLSLRFHHKNGQWHEFEGVATNMLHTSAVSGLVVNFRDVTERKKHEEEITQLNRRFTLAAQSAGIGVWDWAVQVDQLVWDERMHAIYGVTRENCPATYEDWTCLIHVEDRVRFMAEVQASLSAIKNLTTEFRIVRSNGDVRHIRAAALVVSEDNSSAAKMTGINYDVTDQKRLEEQLRQAQKIEAIGQLAGGIAHDFNNILAAMLMHIGMLRMGRDLDADVKESLNELHDEATRAAGLTRQLLLFSRKQIMRIQPVDMNHLVGNLLKMLKRILGENIELVNQAESQPAWAEVDTGMMEQVITNLCVNARDAMPKGGRLLLTTKKVIIGAEHVRENSQAREGVNVLIEVQDFGCGMDDATLARVFEPFFTTKEAGRGTGLGLATVYGIVKQHSGWIEVQSSVGAGTTFKVFIPGNANDPEKAASEVPENFDSGGNETILLVEDELIVRTIAMRVLKGRGYTVLVAVDGVEALSVWEQEWRRIDLILTDMVMPKGFTGLDLVERFRQQKPALKAIVSSGYSADLIAAGGKLQKDITYLAKPYEMAVLIKCVRDCLDREI